MIDPQLFRRYVQQRQLAGPNQSPQMMQPMGQPGGMPQMPQHARIPQPGQQRPGFNPQALGAYGMGQFPRA